MAKLSVRDLDLKNKRLLQQLAVVAGQVQMTISELLDWVGPFASEEGPRLVQNGGKGEQMTISELLDWVDRFASEEGPRLIKDGGKIGVDALLPTIKKLHDLVSAAANLSSGASGNSTKGLHAPRAARALEELAMRLKAAHDLANPLNPPPLPPVPKKAAERHERLPFRPQRKSG
jgi:hypothetical protein